MPVGSKSQQCGLRLQFAVHTVYSGLPGDPPYLDCSEIVARSCEFCVAVATRPCVSATSVLRKFWSWFRRTILLPVVRNGNDALRCSHFGVPACAKPSEVLDSNHSFCRGVLNDTSHHVDK